MTWAEFKAAVDELLPVERKRLGAQPFIDRQIRLAVGDIQRLFPYYRNGITATINADQFSDEGYTSRGTLPAGASLREMYYVKVGTTWDTIRVRWPISEWEFSNRNDLRAGMATIGKYGTGFRYALERRDGARPIWIYPKVATGYAVQVVYDAIEGRGTTAFVDSDGVPFDSPVVDLVYLWVKAKLAREVDENLQLFREYDLSYRRGVASLYAEIQERQRLKVAASDAECAETCCDTDVDDEPTDDDDETPPTGPCDPCTDNSYAEFDTVYGTDGMLESDSSLWRTARCANFYAGDGTITFWTRSDSETVIPNGTDVLQTEDGAIVVRTYVREGTGTTTVTPVYGTTFTVATPLVFPTITDLRNSNFSTYMVWVAQDNQGQVATFVRSSTPATDDGQMVVVNASNVTYVRRT